MTKSKPRVGWLSPTLMILSVIVLVAARLTAERFDFAIANIITLISGFVFYMTALILWLRIGRTHWKLKLAVVLAPIVAIGVGLIFYKPLGVDSELVPRFRYRWAKAPKSSQVAQSEKPTATDSQAESQLTSPPLHGTPPTGSQLAELQEKGARDYSGFLGANRRASLPQLQFIEPSSWTEATPELLWKKEIGAGWSAFSVVGEIAVTLEQKEDAEVLQAYALNSGTPLWSIEWKAMHSNPLGGLGPRSTPVIVDDVVYAQGANGHFVAAKLQTGEKLWDKELLELAQANVEDAIKEVAWGRSSSPLVIDGKVVIPLGGAASNVSTLICFDATTGEEKWRSGKQQVSYASPTLMELNGVKQIVSVNDHTVSSHRLEDGEVLWNADWPGASNGPANVSQPVAIDQKRVLLSKAYGSGAKMLNVELDTDGVWNVSTLWENAAVLKTKFTNVVVHNGFAYGLSDGILECVDLNNGERKWKSKRYRHGQIMLVGSDLLIVAEDGSVAIGEANPDKFEEAFRFQAIEGMTWNNPALAGNLLLVRNGEQAACYRLPVKGIASNQSHESLN